ncbi:MAG: nucleotide exchange factor GrpE [Thermoanaerobaculia bacterium]
MTKPHRPPRSSPDDGVVYIESDGAEDLARALAEAEKAVVAATEKRRQGEELAAAAAAALAGAPAPAAAPELEEKLAEMASRLADVEQRLLSEQEESGRIREALLRKTADFENLKRRTEREKSEFFRFALVEVFSDLLGVLDNFERALMHLANEDAAAGSDVHLGIDMISRQLGDVLRKYGLAEVSAIGLPFDPNVHEAVVREETREADPGTILEVLQKGYLLNDRLLRPAKVKVAAAPAAGGVEN